MRAWIGLVLVCSVLFGCAGKQPVDPTRVNLEVGTIPAEYSEFEADFSKYVAAFGVSIFATESTPDEKVLHAGHVLAQYLDNDEDGRADDPEMVAAMANRMPALVMFATEDDFERSNLRDSNKLNKYLVQDLYGEETHPEGSHIESGFDASLEEILHLLTFAGYAEHYPEALGIDSGSELAAAMDLARGGYFEEVPASYPEEAWYHYDDETCDHHCMMVEYFYWALTSKLGAQEYPGRCEEIAVEWEPCTATALAETDVLVDALLSDPAYKLPTRIPDGSYGVNGD
jgi:hypothetical protein